MLMILVCLLLCQMGWAQRSLSGRVLSQGKNTPVEYATVTVLTTDSVIITGALTDSAGRYMVEGVSQKGIIVTVNCLGFHTYSFRQVVSDRVTELPPIYLTSSAQQIKEVTIQSERQNTSVQLDKQVISAAQFQNAANGTGLDVLKNLSSVTVDTDGKIKLRGSEGFIVLLNGKPSNRAAADILAQLPANEIASVEVITSGSAMYDADGKAGIINIITKKNVAAGWGVSANAMFGGIEPSQYGGDLTVNYNAKKWSFYVAGDYRRFDFDGHRIGTVRTIYQDTTTYMPSEGLRNFKDYQYSVRAGSTVTLGKGNSLDLGLYYGARQNDRQANLHYQDFSKTGSPSDLFDKSWTTPQNTFFNQNLFVRKGSFFTANLTYAHDFKNKSKLSILGQYEYSVLGGPVDDQNFVENSSQVLLHVKSTETSPLNSFRAQADYSNPLRENLKLETGLQFRYLDQNGHFDYQREDLSTGIFTSDPAFSDQLHLRQSIEAAYVQVNGSKGIFSYTVGLRGEYMRRTINELLDSVPSIYNKFDFFPSAQGLLKLGKEQKLKLSYSRRIDRPTLKLIAPFKVQEHSETVEFGNPNAKPELSDIVDLTYSKNWKVLSLTSSLYYNHVTDKIFRVNSIYNRTSLLRIFTNAGNTHSFGAELTLNIKATKWLQFYLSGNAYEYMIEGNFYSTNQNSRSFNYNINGNTTIDIIKGLRFQFDLSYVSNTVTEQGWNGNLFLANASLKYSVPKNGLNFGVKLQNIFNTNSQWITTQTPVFYSSTDYIKYDRLLTFTLGYTFNEKNKDGKSRSLKTDIGEKDF
jgi:outer membrane receptor protein involved in Fe transport